MAHTQTPWKIKCTDGARVLVHVVSAEPVFKGASLLVRIATMHKLKGFAGNALDNATLIVEAVNAWNDAPSLRARLATLTEEQT